MRRDQRRKIATADAVAIETEKDLTLHRTEAIHDRATGSQRLRLFHNAERKRRGVIGVMIDNAIRQMMNRKRSRADHAGTCQKFEQIIEKRFLRDRRERLWNIGDDARKPCPQAAA